MTGTLLIIGLITLFAYAFAGIIGFVPFIIGVIFHFFYFLLDLIAFNLYPMGSLPRILVGGSLIFIIVMFFIKLFTKNH